MEDNHHSPETLQAISILEYWHKIEFFESTNIKDLEENAAGVIQIEQQQLLQPSSLPWINRQQIYLAGKDYSPDKKYSYELFFGIFDRKEIFTRAKSRFLNSSEINEEQLRDEGRTCSIKCRVNKYGILDNNSFEFSTVTWALGQLEDYGLDNLQFQAYQAATQNLHQKFIEIVSVADNLKQQHGYPGILTNYEIIEFLKAMSEWTSFVPQNPVPALFIKLTESKNGEQEEKTTRQPNAHAIPDLTRLADLLATATAENTASTDAGETEAKDINILNSFYIRDIEKALKQIRTSGLIPDSPLGRYLTGSRDKKPDLLLEKGHALLLENLRLNRLPAGRWPSDCRHNMSLMQQFAINTLEQELAVCGLYSVNGPPGTGKTTMLRDLIASNLVKRAGVLASLNHAAEAFSGTITADIAGATRTIPCLRSELCGYEMVVASSNNAAVENISRELPQIKSLGETWQWIDYLKPVAQKLAATHTIKSAELPDDKSYRIEPLTEQSDCWGFIAAALGKQANRDIFGERVFYKKHELAMAPAPADSYRNLYAAIRQYAGNNSFRDAKNAFSEALKSYKNIATELETLEALNDQQNDCQRRQQKLEKLRLRQRQLRAFLAKRHALAPGWWTLKIKKILREKDIAAGLQRRLAAVEASYQLEEQRFLQAAAALSAGQQCCALLTAKYPEAVFAGVETNLEAPEIQRTTFGHTRALNEARSLLTVRALELHQAWLAEVYRDQQCKNALLGLMSAINGAQQNQQAALALWQLLFMIVPVISSTFASIARQFSAFNPGDIGWLFIDEAGQATPQQATGALWRARRAVVVGDPLQIEPVFTIPPAFVEAIAQKEFGEAWREWSPTVQSVQNLADRVNPYGTMQIAQDSWLGSPLRVHRRCDEPMFSIANAIAYNNKMLHGRDRRWPCETFLWGNSRWFDICGEAEGKHYVPAQGQLVLTMLKSWLQHHNQKLPDVYIISPFKQVKNCLKAFLKKELNNINGINQWVNKRIGTVHTFQGKEEQNVILVLGLSEQSRSSAYWASGKPNLLNVAVTRAQKRLYIIGSKNIWAGCPYFDVAGEKLAATAGDATPTPQT